MPDTTAKIATKGCQATGITDEIADRLHNQLGTRLMAVVELEANTRSENADGKQTVGLRITMIEPAIDDDGIAEDHLRDFARALHYNRKLHSPDAQLTIDTRDALEPTVEQVINANPGLIRHDYTPGTLAGECDLCGFTEAYVLHQDASNNPFEIPTDEDDTTVSFDAETDEED